MTTREDIKRWLDEADENSTHMLVVCDTYDHSDYPVYTDDIQHSLQDVRDASMQRIMEVYNLSMDLNEQLNCRRAWNI